jgi:hypothetical protein
MPCTTYCTAVLRRRVLDPVLFLPLDPEMNFFPHPGYRYRYDTFLGKPLFSKIFVRILVCYLFDYYDMPLKPKGARKKVVFIRVVDPDPGWIRIQRLCRFRSVLGIRIPDPDPGSRKLRNFSGKIHF